MSYYAALNAYYFLEQGCLAADKKKMNDYNNERFEWIEVRKPLDGLMVSTASRNTGIVHDKWVLYEYKYPQN